MKPRLQDTCLDTTLSRMSWTLRSNSHSLDTGITPPSESGRGERVSTSEILRWEMSYSMSRVAWAAAPMPVWNSDRLWSAFLLAEVKVMLFASVEDWNPKAVGGLEKVTNQFRCWHLGSQRYRCKKGPSLASQFMRPNARSKLQFRHIRNSTNQVEKPRRLKM